MTDRPSIDYAGALAGVDGLAPDVAEQLAEHARAREAWPDPAVVRLAGILLAGQPGRLAVPTALAQARAVAGELGLGDSLVALQTAMLAVARALRAGRAGSVWRQAVAAILRQVQRESARLLEECDRE